MSLKVGEYDNELIRYLTSVFNKQVTNLNYNPYANYSSKIEKEVDEAMTMKESAVREGEIKGKIEGEINGVIKTLLKRGNTDAQIIEELMNDNENPLTKEEAEKALEKYKAEHSK